MSEISNNLGVSRNAIHKVIQGVEDKLVFYEEKLRLFQINRKICDIIELENIIEMKEQLERIVCGDEFCG